MTVTSRDLAEAGLTAHIDGDAPSVEDSRELLDPVTEYVRGLVETPIDPVVVSETRFAARRESEVDAAAPIDAAQATSRASDGPMPSLLEVEFVAVYW